MQGDLFSKKLNKSKSNKSYEEAYQKLNPKQKEAVDNIEGAVLVNAGPGTGKTQILATRIGKILLEQDIAPHNILCLTFTDAATIAMRNRLVEIIGPTAHQIHIYTFHGFCNSVIQENLEYFGGYRKLEPISELEQVDILRELIDSLDDENPLKRFKNEKYFESKRLKNLFDLMKKENISPDQMLGKIDRYLEALKEKDDYYYKRKTTNKKTGKVYVKGDFKEDKYQTKVDGFLPLRAAVQEFEKYKSLFKENERYDYADMILWVINAFKENALLLSDYQERYQYFLVDEYQDTNGSQNDILNFLISYWDKPNVFVVGDDDQAIYKFQGANLRNIIEFKEAYQPHTIVLEENYRSNQKILDASKRLISNNAERIINEDPSLTKDLVASGKEKDKPVKPQVFSFEKISQEYAFVASSLEDQYKNDQVAFNDTAVIYRNHKQINDLVTVLEKRNVPFNIKKRVNILELPLIRNLTSILTYINDEYKKYGNGKGNIFEILHYNYFKVDSIDIGKIALYCQKKNEEGNYPEWREVISSEEMLSTLGLRKKENVLNVSSLLEDWIKKVPEITLQSLFEIIINKGNILNHVMTQPDRSWRLQVISTFFEFIKKETAKNPEMGLNELLSVLIKMNENDISIPVNKIISSENGVHFITAHSAKGLEFQKVYILGATKKTWDKSPSSQNQYSYPDEVNVDTVTNQEDERRLFYVAMTRAKRDLIITFSNQTEEGKVLGGSQFIDELKDIDFEIANPKLDEQTIAEFYLNLLELKDKTIPLIEKDLIDKWLDGYRMSVTHLNKYLKCPITFYFESILRVPHARNASSGFGSAMHDALHFFFENINKTNNTEVEKLIFYFKESMLKHKSHFTSEEYESYVTHGTKTLTQLHKEKVESWLKVDKFAVEKELSHAEYKGVPLKGFIDKIEVFKDHAHVVDYKTGNPSNKKTKDKLKPPSEKDKIGGDYWRQLVFYKILLDSDKRNDYRMFTGEIDFIEPDRKTGAFSNHKLVVSQADIDAVGLQIVETQENIKAHKFDTTCKDEECLWCNFVQNNYVLDPSLKPEEHEYA